MFSRHANSIARDGHNLWDEFRVASVTSGDSSSVPGSNSGETRCECLRWLSSSGSAIGAGEGGTIGFSEMDGEVVGANGSHDETAFIFVASPGLNLVTGGNSIAFKDRLPSDFCGGSGGDFIGSFLNYKLERKSVVS